MVFQIGVITEVEQDMIRIGDYSNQGASKCP